MNLAQKVFKQCKLFNKIRYKNKNNDMSETKEDVKKFQWIKGDNFGKVVEVKSEDDKMYYFTDGSQIFKSVVSEFLEKVEGDILPLPGADQINFTTSGKPTEKAKPVNNASQAKLMASDSPQSELHGLINKLSKKHIVAFEPKLNLNVVDPQVFKLLVENADENPEKLIQTITEVAMSQIEIDKLKDYLQQEITNFLNNYYNE